MPPANLFSPPASPGFAPVSGIAGPPGGAKAVPGLSASPGNILSGNPFGNPYPMIFPPAPQGPAPTLLGFRPVYANDVYTPSASPPAASIPAAAAETATVADPAATASIPESSTPGKASPAGTSAATATPASYEEELGDRVTTILKRNPQLSSKLQAWEADLEAKGLDLETLAENPDQLGQELLANPNSMVNQQIDEFKQTRTYKMVHAVYKMVPGPAKKLMIKALPDKYEAMAEQLEDALFKQPASKPSASRGDSLSLGDEPSASSSKSRPHRPSSTLDETLDKLGGSSGPSDGPAL